MIMKCKLVRCVFNRWLVVNAENENLAWSGSRWVPIFGTVQVSNFDTRSAAAGYATSFGFEVVD